MRILLASTSPARRALLDAAGVRYIARAPGVDEHARVEAAELDHGPLSPEQHVMLLARAKAEALLDDLRTEAFTGLVLGGDSAFELGGAVYGKPHTPERARERWLQQRGQTGTLWSGHWLIDVQQGEPVGAAGRAAHATVTFADDLDDAEIDAYVASGEPLEVAGAFTIDSLGMPFITRIDGDPSTVVGCSIPTLRSLVRELGHTWPSLWRDE